VFGTGVISVQKDDDSLVYRSYHVGDIAFAQNSKGLIDTVFRDIYYTARQAVQEFGEENLPDKVNKMAQNPTDANQKVKFIHAVVPNSDFDKTKIDSLKFRSLFIFEEEKMIVKEEQFKSNPYFIMRFTIAPGELWGRGPVTEMLPEIRMLNKMRLDFMEAAELANHPPMMVEDDGVIGQPVTEPRGIIYMRTGAAEPKPWNTGGNLPLTNEILLQQQNFIREGMLINVFQTLEGVKNVSSATEAQIRKEDGLAIVSAVVGAVQKDALDPIIVRSMGLIDKKKLPPAPRKFDFDIIYQGRMAMAMSALHANAIELFLAKVAPYEPLGAMDNINMDKATRHIALAGSVPAEVMVPMDVVEAKRAEQKAAAQQQLEIENAEAASQAVKNAGAPIDETSLAAQIGGQ